MCENHYWEFITSCRRTFGYQAHSFPFSFLFDLSQDYFSSRKICLSTSPLSFDNEKFTKKLCNMLFVALERKIRQTKNRSLFFSVSTRYPAKSASYLWRPFFRISIRAVDGWIEVRENRGLSTVYSFTFETNIPTYSPHEHCLNRGCAFIDVISIETKPCLESQTVPWSQSCWFYLGFFAF